MKPGVSPTETLRFPQVLHNQPHGLRRVELGEAALVTFFLLFSFCIGHSRTSLGLLFFLSASVRASPLLLFLAPDTHGLTFLSASVRASPLLLFLAPDTHGLTFLSVSVRASPLHFSASDVHGLHSDFFFSCPLQSVPVRCIFLPRTFTDFTRTSFSCPPQSVPVRCIFLPRTFTDFTRTSFSCPLQSVPVRCLFVVLTHLTDYFQKSVARTYVRRYAKGSQNIMSIASNVSTAPASSGFASQALIRLRALTSSAL